MNACLANSVATKAPFTSRGRRFGVRDMTRAERFVLDAVHNL
jgi:hypothetical protein